LSGPSNINLAARAPVAIAPGAISVKDQPTTTPSVMPGILRADPPRPGTIQPEYFTAKVAKAAKARQGIIKAGGEFRTRSYERAFVSRPHSPLNMGSFLAHLASWRFNYCTVWVQRSLHDLPAEVEGP
jgi:hypothetical protein